jgi:hypothetical protein
MAFKGVCMSVSGECLFENIYCKSSVPFASGSAISMFVLYFKGCCGLNGRMEGILI